MQNDHLIQGESKTCGQFSVVSAQAKREQAIEPSRQRKRQGARQRKSRHQNPSLQRTEVLHPSRPGVFSGMHYLHKLMAFCYRYS